MFDILKLGLKTKHNVTNKVCDTQVINKGMAENES